MSYLSEAYNFLVPNYYFHNNKHYMVIANDYEVEKLHFEKINEPKIQCHDKCSTIKTYQSISPTVTINNFPQLPNMGAKDDLYRQRGRGWNEPIFLSNNEGKYCNTLGTCSNYNQLTHRHT